MWRRGDIHTAWPPALRCSVSSSREQLASKPSPSFLFLRGSWRYLAFTVSSWLLGFAGSRDSSFCVTSHVPLAPKRTLSARYRAKTATDL
ncbi:hypothetical protein FRC02_006067 [Tulasnella sp. 418]|nr:hypothetical protein FRC02_006067 [Tulasnella sp. 418]